MEPVPDPRKCAMVGCDRNHDARGYCQLHYRRLLRSGVLKKLPPEVRFPLKGDAPRHSYRVRADRSVLPGDWWMDPMFFEEIQERIKECLRIGMSASETARKIGVNARTVVRHRARAKAHNGADREIA